VVLLFFRQTILSITIVGVLLVTGGAQPTRPVKKNQGLPAKVKGVIDRINADSMRGHLSFLASDLLEGRNTPSRGLDIAADYLAAQMMRAGVEPAGDEGGRKSYFQVARWQLVEPDPASFELTINEGRGAYRIDVNQASFQTDQPVDVTGLKLLKVDISDAATLEGLRAEQLAGKAVLIELPELPRGDRSRMMEGVRARNQITARILALKPALLLSISRTGAPRGLGGGRLIDPEQKGGGGPTGPRIDSILTVHDPRLINLYDTLKSGEATADLTFRLGPPRQQTVGLKNVIGIIPGSDPVLKDTFVIVSAHYDHVGIGQGVDGDRIYNGANDDASGTVSMVELATALAGGVVKPKRTLVFIAWFGEEKGLLGSRYYGRHPVFPLQKTVAMVNLEQVGRTDTTEGPQVNSATLTGFAFTDLGPIFKAAGELTGIKVYKHDKNSDAFFGRSDNQALADAGIPAHTLCTAFVYPDYHQPSDHWDKIDYQNMARVTRMVALALLNIANKPQAPQWNEANTKTARYVEAWRKLSVGR